MTELDPTQVTIEFASEEKANAFRRYMGTEAGRIWWDPFDDEAYDLVWLAEEAA